MCQRGLQITNVSPILLVFGRRFRYCVRARFIYSLIRVKQSIFRMTAILPSTEVGYLPFFLLYVRGLTPSIPVADL